MIGILITFAIGFIIIILDWHLATKPDEKDKIKRRKPLTPVQRKSLWELFLLTCGAAVAVYVLQRVFS